MTLISVLDTDIISATSDPKLTVNPSFLLFKGKPVPVIVMVLPPKVLAVVGSKLVTVIATSSAA